ncbi:ABC transporter permease [Candidatus Woesearchaeota archaeon]|nr:ABC transporter permease [Candidatus Woesearchaeota archaeon]
MKFDYFRLALSGLKHRGLRSWLTMIGIFIGIAAVVALIGLGEGLREAINSQFGFIGADIITVAASGGLGVPGSGAINPLTDKELEKIRGITGVKNAAGRLLESTKILFNKKAVFTFAASMPGGEERELIEDMVNMKAEEGRLLKDGDKYAVVLGYNFLEKERFGKPITAGKKITLQDKEFTVVGIMTKKGNLQIDQAVLMNEDVMRELFERNPDDYDVMAVKFDEAVGVDKIKADIEKELRKVRNVKEGEEDFSVETPASILENVNTIILGVQIFVYVIASISILVGGIGIMNSMYTAVVERTKEIGIMKSIGAKNSTIFSLFFIESGLLGAVGGLMGVVIGFSAATGLVFAGRLVLGSEIITAQFSPLLIIGALIFSFTLGSFFGTLPAMQAAQLNPVEALRFAK